MLAPVNAQCSAAPDLKYLVVSFLPRSTGVLPTAFLITQLPLVTFGISLKVLCRRFTSSSLSPSMKRAMHLSKAAKACSNSEVDADMDYGVSSDYGELVRCKGRGLQPCRRPGISRKELVRKHEAPCVGVVA